MDYGALDRHITGNFGEDQFKQNYRYSRSFIYGMMARRKGRSLESCRCTNPTNRKEWRRGWIDEDQETILLSNEGIK